MALRPRSISLFGNVFKRMCGPQRRYGHYGNKLIYAEYGDPMKVVEKCEDVLPEIQSHEILIKMLAAPVNPADINTIQGKYPSKPTELPAVAGNEGVGKVECVGNAVTGVLPGDHVVPLTNLLGTWRSHMIIKCDQVMKIPHEIGLAEASSLTVNPCTAYRMLQDFVKLQPGDVVIQNGANSACGQNVIQLCKIWGIKSVNIIRDRRGVDTLRKYLRSLGADEVLTEEELRATFLFKAKQLPKPKLGLNCVGGKSALEMMRHLDHGATIVTYGGMSREPVTVPTSALIFKDIKVRGFWMTAWVHRQQGMSEERFNMFCKLIEYMVDKKLVAPANRMVDFDNYKEALMNTMTVKGMIGLKYILDFTKK